MERAGHAFAVDDDTLIGMIGKPRLLFVAKPANAAIRLQQPDGGGLRNVVGQPTRRLCETGRNCPARHADEIAMDRFGGIEVPVAVVGCNCCRRRAGRDARSARRAG